jgi:hypothetical protein
MKDSENVPIKPLTQGLRLLLFIASILVFLAGVPLFVGTEKTDIYFAWTLKSPLTAASLGAAYWASFFLEFFASRERVWARARIAIPAVLIFTSLMLLATLIHIDRLHLHSPLLPRAITWFWLAIYVMVPPIMLVLLILQLRTPGKDPPRYVTLPHWMRFILGMHAAVMLVLGAALFLKPLLTASLFWPWMLTPLTGRAIGAWLLGLGAAAISAIYENDFARLRIAMITYTLLSGLEFIALARYPKEVNWNSPGIWIYILFLLSILAVGLYGWRVARKIGRVHD